MKILFVSSGNKYPEGSIIVLNQIESLKQRGICIDHFLIKGNGLIGYLGNIRKLRKELQLGNYTLAHSHYSLSAYTTSFARICGPRIPHLVSLMGSDAFSRGMQKHMIRYFSKRVWTKTIVKSQQMAERLKLTNARVIPNGIDLEKISRIENERKRPADENLNGTASTVIFPADPSRPEKNFQLAEKAAQLANQKLKVIHGISHAALIEELLASKVVLLTSTHEGSPNIIKEAMACKRPVVSTDVGDVKYLFGSEPGHFIADNQPEDVAEKLKSAILFSENEKQTKGRSRLTQLNLSSQQVANQLYELYCKYH